MKTILPRVGAIALALSLFVILPTTVAQAWTLAQPITATPMDSIFPAAVVDGDENLHILWQETTANNGPEEIYYITGKDDTWSEPVNVSRSPAPKRSLYADLALDQKGQLLAIWVEFENATDSYIYYAVKNADGWSEAIALYTEHLVGIPVLTKGSYGMTDTDLYAAWPVDTDGDLYADTILLSQWDGNRWSTPTGIDIETGSLDMVDLTVDGNGNLHLVWNGNTSGDPTNLSLYEVRYSVYKENTWTTPVNISQTGAYSFWPSLAVDTAGIVHVIWIDGQSSIGPSPSIFDDLLYQRLTTDGWLASPLRLSTHRGALFPVARADQLGRVHLTWTENSASDPNLFRFRTRYARWDGQGLQDAQQIASAPTNSGQTAGELALNSAGDVWLVWSEGETAGVAQLTYSRLPIEQISQAEPITALADAPSLAGKSADDLHALWVEGEAQSYLQYSHWDGTVWGNPERVTPPEMDSEMGVIAVDSDRTPHVVGFEFDIDGNHLFYTQREASSWREPQRISASPPDAALPAIAIASQDNKIHIAWQALDDADSQDFAIDYRSGDGTRWSEIERISSPGHSGNYVNITVDQLGQPHAIWYDVKEQEIYYAVRRNGTWTTPVNISNTPTTLPTATISSQGPTIAVDSHGTAHIVWLDTRNGTRLDTVYYANSSDGPWSRVQLAAQLEGVADAQRGAGSNVQIVLASDDDLHVVWHDVDPDGRPTLFHSRRMATTWSSPTILLSQYQYAQRPSAFLDENNHLHLIWSELMATRQIFYQRFDRFDWIKVVNESGEPMPATRIYRNGEEIGRTDRRGLFFPAALQSGDTLATLSPVYAYQGQRTAHTTADSAGQNWAYRLYLANWQSAQAGEPQPHVVTDPQREQFITAQPKAPLVLFNLVVSVEWNANAAYLAALETAFYAASDYLYDLTDGQMALGHVAIYDAGQHWANADIQISAKNRMRPYAYIGGIQAGPPQVIRVGRHWDGQTSRFGSWAESNGFRTIIHEFGHYALHLYDEYFGYEIVNERVLGEWDAYCTDQGNRDPEADQHSTNASAMDYQYTTSELSARGVNGLWLPECERTAQWQRTGESTWETWTRHYADTESEPRWRFVTPMERNSILPGPPTLPTFIPDFPGVAIHNDEENGLAQNITAKVTGPDGIQPNARVTLYTAINGNVVGIDQGVTSSKGELVIYGASPGDTIQATQIAKGLAGTTSIGTATEMTLSITTLGSTQRRAVDTISSPYLLITAEPSPDPSQVTLHITFHNSNDAAELNLLITEPDSTTGHSPSLSYSPIQNAYEGDLQLNATSSGTGRVRLLGEVEGRFFRFFTEYRLQRLHNHEDEEVYATDGNAHLYLEANSFIESTPSFIIMAIGGIPGGLPTEYTLVNEPYLLATTATEITLQKPAILKMYYPTDQALVETELRIHWWNANQASWIPLESNIDTEQKAVLATISQIGIYALMSLDQSQLYLPMIANESVDSADR